MMMASVRLRCEDEDGTWVVSLKYLCGVIVNLLDGDSELGIRPAILRRCRLCRLPLLSRERSIFW